MVYVWSPKNENPFLIFYFYSMARKIFCLVVHRLRPKLMFENISKVTFSIVDARRTIWMGGKRYRERERMGEKGKEKMSQAMKKVIILF